MLYQNIALITARGGSKGLPRKNILPLAGKPLIGWTIEAALGCPLINRVFVTTDDAEIARISSELGAEIIPRPDNLASDTASSIDVVSHALDWFQIHDIHCQNILLLQPTSPLRTSKHLYESISLFDDKNALFVISVFAPTHSPIKSYVEREDGSISGLYSEDAPYQRRQDLPRALQPNGAIYMFSCEAFSKYKNFPRTKVFPYVMTEEDSSDIDTLEDLLKVEKKLMETK